MSVPNTNASGIALHDLRQTFAGWARGVRRGYPQNWFARKHGLSEAALQDLEQGRVLPSRATVMLMHAIAIDPEFVKRVAKIAESDLALIDAHRSYGRSAINTAE